MCVCVRECVGWGLVVRWESDGLGKMTGWHKGQARWRLNMLGSGERCQSCSQPSRNTGTLRKKMIQRGNKRRLHLRYSRVAGDSEGKDRGCFCNTENAF